jgi:tryptophanyl-tRNA synthetase
MKKIVLTGINSTGTPHLGNYVGSIRPALELQKQTNVDALYFVADGHSLVKLWEPKLRQQAILELAATWLALGLDPHKVTFYRQSHIPEIFELAWILTSVTSKGLMNRAHAYKDAVNKNLEEGHNDADNGITMGLFCYPILMAADILIFNAEQVPVGKDQIQHLEMARDIAVRFNHLYGKTFSLPEALVDEHMQILPGLDGRKMSKSYGNTIPLFSTSKELKKLIMKIKTNSLMPGEPKDPEGCTLFTYYRAFAEPEELASYRQAYADGISWGDAKTKLFELLDHKLAEPRARYEQLMLQPQRIHDILEVGAAKARERLQDFMIHIRTQLGF